MLRIGRRLFATALVCFSANAVAQSDAYKAGYSAGQQIGRVIGLALPVVAVSIAVIVGWLVYRAWRNRRTAKDRQA